MSTRTTEERLAALQARQSRRLPSPGPASQQPTPPAPTPRPNRLPTPAPRILLSTIQSDGLDQRVGPRRTSGDAQAQVWDWGPEPFVPAEGWSWPRAEEHAPTGILSPQCGDPLAYASERVSRRFSERWRALIDGRPGVSWERVAAGGASVVSFAAMIVAMGPILKSPQSSEVQATTVAEGAAAGATVGLSSPIPAAPDVDIQLNRDQAGVTSTGNPLHLSALTVDPAQSTVAGAAATVAPT
ncbi:MAG: hypothetical protein OER95_07980, partial [Acidimicrobiia bacterium]|nr:hypothetical protein [Acidimicrobiia bacterium]